MRARPGRPQDADADQRPQCNTAIGISIDLEGYLWLVDHAGYAWKIDQENVQWNNKVIIPGAHYVYSDMTGGQVASILPQ